MDFPLLRKILIQKDVLEAYFLSIYIIFRKMG